MNKLHGLLKSQLRRFSTALNNPIDWNGIDVETRMVNSKKTQSSSEGHFRGLFEHAPVSIWEEDWSAVRQYIDDLRGAGVMDFTVYFDGHPEEVAECAARVKIVDVNRATLELYQAESKTRLLAKLPNFLDSELLTAFKSVLLALAHGDMIFETETLIYTLLGERRVVFIRVAVAPGFEQTWARVFVGMNDITKGRQVEEALRQSEERYKLMSWATKDAVWDWDLQTNQVWWGPGLQKIFHHSAQLTQTDAVWWFDHIHPEDRVKVKRTINQALDGGMEFWSKEYRFQGKDGIYVDIMDRGYILRDDRGKAYRMIGAMMDITDRKRAEQALMESEALYRQILETAGDLIYTVDRRGRLTYINPTGLRLMGYKSAEEVLGRHYLEFVHAAWHERVRLTYNRQFTEKSLNTYFEFLAVTRQRSEIWLGQSVQIVKNNNRVIGFQAVARDITAQKEAEVALQAANRKMQQFLDELQRLNREIALLNEMSHLLQVCISEHQAYRIIADISTQLFPDTSGALYLANVPQTLCSLVTSWGNLSSTGDFSPNDCKALRRLRRPLDEKLSAQGCLHFGESLPTFSYCLPVQVQGEIRGILHLQSQQQKNLDEAKRQLAHTVAEQAGMALSNLRLREMLREQSIRDPLTGLYNRRYMEEVLKQQLSRVPRHLHSLGIVMIDIDHFKSFNDKYGHAVGDALLRELGLFLQSHIRDEDIACRYGGEEFTLIMPDASLEVVQQRAEHLRKSATKLQVQDTGKYYEGITLSLGVAIYPLHGLNIEDVLRVADAALYRAKQEGRDRVVITEKAC